MTAIWTLYVSWLICKERKRILDSKPGNPFQEQFRIWKSISSLNIRLCQRTCLIRLQHQCLSICRAHTHTLMPPFQGQVNYLIPTFGAVGSGQWAVASLPGCLSFPGGDQGKPSRGNYNCSRVGFCSVCPINQPLCSWVLQCCTLLNLHYCSFLNSPI